MAENISVHTPVLLKEVLQYLDPKPGDFMIDGTVDGGGHAAAIIKKTMPGGMFLGVDWDERMVRARAAHRMHGGHERYVRGNYADLPAILAKRKAGESRRLIVGSRIFFGAACACGTGVQFR